MNFHSLIIKNSFLGFLFSSSNQNIFVSKSLFVNHLDSCIRISEYFRDFSSSNTVSIKATKFENCQSLSSAGGALYCYNLNNNASISCCTFIKCSCSSSMSNPIRNDYAGGSIAYVGKSICMQMLSFESSSAFNAYGKCFGGYAINWVMSMITCLASYGTGGEISIAGSGVDATSLNSSYNSISQHAGFTISYGNPSLSLSYYHFANSGGAWCHHYNINDMNSLTKSCNFINITQSDSFLDLISGGGIIDECYFSFIGNSIFSSRTISSYILTKCNFIVNSIVNPCNSCSFNVLTQNSIIIHLDCFQDSKKSLVLPLMNMLFSFHVITLNNY